MINKLWGSIHACTKPCFPQRAAAMPGACSTSLQKRYCSETPLVPKSPSCVASDGSYLHTIGMPKPPSASQSGLLLKPAPPGGQRNAADAPLHGLTGTRVLLSMSLCVLRDLSSF